MMRHLAMLLSQPLYGWFSLLLSLLLGLHQLDVKNAFLHSHLHEIVYSQEPSGFIDPRYPDYVCRLHKSLYGLKQTPRARFQWFATYARSIGFVESKYDASLFILHKGNITAYLLLYVDDIILTASSPSSLSSIYHFLC